MTRINQAVKIAHQAGELLLEMFNSGFKFSGEIKGTQDIVTEADLAAEELIKNELVNSFPKEKIISEESDFDKEHSSQQFTNSWIIDPLDGTRNFSIGNPNFAVSIGYVEENGEFSGVVYLPILNHTFVAVDGQSFLNEKEIAVNPTKNLDDAIVAFWDKREKDPSWDKPEIYSALLGKVKVLRVFGASAIEKSWVASGQVDLYIGNSSSIFGAVAGVALVRNAGGVAYNLQGGRWQLGDVGIVCGNEVLVKQALQNIN